MPTPWLICIKAVDGGLFVALFAVIGEMLQPKRFAGIFGASPAVSLANLLVIALVEGDGTARKASDGMIAGAIALAVASGAAIPAVRRWGAVLGSAVLWAVWIAVAVAVGFPLAGGAGGAAAAAGPQVARDAASRRPEMTPGSADGSEDDRLFAVDFRALREIRSRPSSGVLSLVRRYPLPPPSPSPSPPLPPPSSPPSPPPPYSPPPLSSPPFSLW